ncbi:MAG: HIT domain-containing protein [Rickettsiales bacterium]|jgi:diadenosine tetraphosphate (Ap4A) HIT family hydrolase|nr:HIT domain-containing protein [Rickettsiales bacterium]
MFDNNYDRNNVFAKIIRGELPCDKVAESEHAIAFRDIHPNAPFHILVAPRGPYVNAYHFIRTASAAEQLDFWKLAADVADMANADGFNGVMNTGKSHGQAVPHFHLHILSGKKLF